MTEERIVTCINCPLGCRVKVTLDGGAITSVEGHSCKRGETYARQECIEPRRMVTAVLPVFERSTPVSVKTSSPIPKAKIGDVMRALSSVKIVPPVKAGDVIAACICDTGVDIIATSDAI